ncbi:hypothetical protein PSTG_09672 [Puccinia striiformis f. sp. tritici PST-78]|uniref:Uncharacterized protein n=2 Tax=Puccinia striiformis f. sp. tritici TaxID=168172 RepID=A0A0L0VCT6_9BASI|nr:hypothetical protein PSTG_09672 [Puccinia striiformis f. sp. tritici PST-78]
MKLFATLIGLMVLQGVIGSPAAIKALTPRSKDPDNGENWYPTVPPPTTSPSCTWSPKGC